MNNNNSGPKQQVRSSSSFSLPRLGPEKENASHPPNQEGPEGTRTKQQPNTTRSPAGLQRLHSTSPGSAITTTTHLLSRRKRGILRYGETMESLFLLHDNHKNPHDEEEQRRRCQRLIDHARSDDNDDASLWRKVLENTSHEVSAGTYVQNERNIHKQYVARSRSSIRTSLTLESSFLLHSLQRYSIV